MKKILLSLSVLMLISCNTTTISEDTMMLQKAYPNADVYRLEENRYIVADSIVRDIRVTSDGQIYSIVKIK